MRFGLEKIFGYTEPVRDDVAKVAETEKVKQRALSDRQEVQKLQLLIDGINAELNEMQSLIDLNRPNKELEAKMDKLFELRNETSSKMLDHSFEAEEAEAYIAEVSRSLDETRKYLFSGKITREDLPLQ